jgi:hypothetical protein
MPPSLKKFQNGKAEEMRLRSLYRDMALRGDVRPSGPLSRAGLVRLVGPDCAYHLYALCGRMQGTTPLAVRGG